MLSDVSISQLQDLVQKGNRADIYPFLRQVLENAYQNNAPSTQDARRLASRAIELQLELEKLISRLSMADQFFGEEVQSNYTYPEQYKGPKPIEEQILYLANTFGLDPSHALKFTKTLPPVPNGAEGYFAVPTVASIAAKHFPKIMDRDDLYCRALRLVQAKIAEMRPFSNYLNNKITPAQLRIFDHTAYAERWIAERQPGDIIIIAAQLGLLRRGCSNRRAHEVFVCNEFGLTSLSSAAILLVHPERIISWNGLNMICSGDQCGEDSDCNTELSGTLLFDFDHGFVKFTVHWNNNHLRDYGPTSGFLFD